MVADIPGIRGGGVRRAVVKRKEDEKELLLQLITFKELALGQEEEEVKKSVLEQVELLRGLKHRHILGVVDAFPAAELDGRLGSFEGGDLTELSGGPSDLCMLTEHKRRTMLELIEEQRGCGGKLEEERIWKWVIQLCSALGQLHAIGLVLGSLHPRQVYIDEHDDVRVFPVGSLTLALQRREEREGLGAGTPSPETFLNVSPERLRARLQSFTPKCDMWALGCSAYWLVTLSHPFVSFGKDILRGIQNEPPRKIRRSEHNYSWCLRSLPQWLLQKDPSYRPTAMELYTHFLFNWPQNSYLFTEEGNFLSIDSSAVSHWSAEALDECGESVEWNTEQAIEKAVDGTETQWEDLMALYAQPDLQEN
ncbi:hypothetical protein GUITHDRAFT_121937 [Guillardia theta CCMP2712]|uniref:non-specific serine/threonine protein kinase n=1 Tax=Guillardia theta (strain CCMP2712) TaxID=905079 RepID=L1I6I3_GUITC|nr:hypothetical protein GUITHDRAFT_121937 [Guillardia theta CCMP2712]EKX31863.1 hypothetical protein GUITHDRAFT_121937 [Guillardia theta CCMP2712]|eukprot:XP_005818843.1 hypothetical protein GUITHDRAFT_121937 [Guillardia theta CCMP2712]